MTDEIPDGLAQLREFLLREYTGILPEAASGSEKERERNFLSRALAAYAVQKLASCTREDAASAVVDGGGDGGIDAIYHAHQTTEKLFFVQSKFVAKGTGEPDGLEKFCNGLEAVLEGDLGYFSENEAWQKWVPQITKLLNSTDQLEIYAVFVYSSIHPINTSKLGQFEKLRKRFSEEANYFNFRSYNLTSLKDWLTGADQPLGIPKIEITLHFPGKLDSPYKTIFGMISLADMAKLYQDYGKQLVAANIRGYKGDTEVNAGILATLQEKPELFVYLNNGMTAYCKRFNVFHLDKGNEKFKRITAYEFSIVNGAQTLGTIGSQSLTWQDPGPDGYVFIKIISLESCENDLEFAQEITRTANYQNRIDSHNFIALDPYHQEVARMLAMTDIHYHYRDDMDTPASDEHNFTFKDAATALACLDVITPEDLISQILAKRESLWSTENVYADDDILPSRYSRVFRTNRSARTVWRAVQVQSIVIERMKESTRPEIGLRKAFFENARWLILHLIFFKLRLEQGNDLTLSIEEVDKIRRTTIEFSELLWGQCETLGLISRRLDGAGFEGARHFKSIFSNSADCAALRTAMLEELNRKRRPTTEVIGDANHD